MKRRFLYLAPAVFLAAIVSCGQPQQQNKSKGTIGVSLKTLANPFFKTIGDTIKEEAEKHGYEADVNSGEEDVDKQYKQVKDFIVKKVSAIVLCPCDSKSIAQAIKEANKAGIPVFTADLACSAKGVDVVSHIATDNYEGGKLAGVAMIEALGKSGGKVLILHHKPAESCVLRVKGFTETIDNYNKDRKSGRIDIVQTLEGGGHREIGNKATEDALIKNPDLAGIFAINDPSALGARAALEKARIADKVKIIGFDGQPMGKRAIKEGKIYADPIQFPDKIARMTVKTIVDYFNGIRPAAQQLIPTALYRQVDGLKDPTLK